LPEFIEDGDGSFDERVAIRRRLDALRTAIEERHAKRGRRPPRKLHVELLQARFDFRPIKRIIGFGRQNKAAQFFDAV
jgi:hypothetical protein